MVTRYGQDSLGGGVNSQEDATQQHCLFLDLFRSLGGQPEINLGNLSNFYH
jgi:hypothetical protein